MGEFFLILALGACIVLGLSELFKISALQVIRDIVILILLPAFLLFIVLKSILIIFNEGETINGQKNK
jgi:hypothetical protein